MRGHEGAKAAVKTGVKLVRQLKMFRMPYQMPLAGSVKL